MKHHILNTFTMKRMISFIMSAVMTVSTATMAQHTNSEDNCKKESKQTKIYICPNCKSDVDATNKFCSNCGTKLN